MMTQLCTRNYLLFPRLNSLTLLLLHRHCHHHHHHHHHHYPRQLTTLLRHGYDDVVVQSLFKTGDLDSSVRLLRKMSAAASDDTYLALLKVCIKRKSLRHAKEVYDHIRSHGVTLRGFLGDYLVVTLAKCGAIEDAFRIFKSLQRHTVFSWNAIISSFVDFGQSEEALVLFESMMLDCNQVEPDSYTYVSLFKACGNTINAMVGRKLHAVVCMEGYSSDAFVVSTLISMYGKVGQVLEAELVFLSLPEHNVVSWNAMMSSYLQQSQAGKALRLYRQMLEEGVDGDHHTLVFMLQACCNLISDGKNHLGEQSSSLISLEIGNALHVHVRRKGFTKSVFVGTALLSMYRKCGSVEEAENVFIVLSGRNVVSWNAMISTYVDHGQGEKALHLYKQMQHEGIQPNELTYAMSLQACGILAESEESCLLEGQLIKANSLHIGKTLHGDVRAKGLDSDVFVGTALLSMYGKCRAITEAESAFFSLSQQDVVAWNALMSAYLEQREGRKALQVYNQIHEKGMSPGQITFVLALQACGTLAESGESISQNDQPILLTSLHIGKVLHADAQRKGLVSDMIICNTLVSMYGKCGAVLEAEHFCGQIQRNIVTWNAMLSTYLEQFEGVKALQSFVQLHKEGIEPNEMTFVMALQACCQLTDMKECVIDEQMTIEMMTLQIGQALREDAWKGGFASSVFVGTALLAMYGKCGAVLEAENIFAALPVRDVVSWNALLGAYIEQDQGEKALQLFRQMQQEGARSHQRTFMIAMQACGNIAKKEESVLFRNHSTKAVSLELGQALHKDAHHEGYASDTIVGNTLLSMYRKCRAISKAEEVFNEILHPDSVSWNSMLSTRLEQNQGEEAIRIYKEIQKQHLNIDDVTLTCILQACSSTGSLEICKYIHFGVVSAGCDHIPSVSVALVHAYGGCSSMLNAHAFFDELTDPNLVVWNAYITGHASEGNYVVSLEMFELLRMASLRPDVLTYTSLLSSCSHAGLVGIGLECFLFMGKDKVTPDLRHYGTLVDMLGRAGDFKKAENLLQELPIQANSAIWLSLLGACRIHNNLLLAKQAFDNAVVISPDDATAYVIISDIYAQTGLQSQQTY